jgi:hypothetical protein
MPAQPTTAATSSIRRLTAVVTASLVVGLLLPVVLALGPASAGGESRMTGAALLAWGIGWALIAVLSTRFTDVADARRGRQAAEAALLAAEEASGAAEMTAAASEPPPRLRVPPTTPRPWPKPPLRRWLAPLVRSCCLPEGRLPTLIPTSPPP